MQCFDSPTCFRSACLLGLVVFLVGCQETGYAPVHGKVLYKGKPLEYGSVMFQPEAGQPAAGMIQSDGTFSLSSDGVTEGASIGSNKVRVTCFAAQKPRADGSLGEEPALGPSLIPEKYNSFEHSKLTVDVPAAGLDDLVLDLK